MCWITWSGNVKGTRKRKDAPQVRSVVTEAALGCIRDAVHLPPVVRVAAHAALLLSNKYYALTDECEAYRISIVMCPDKKLDYFMKRGWSPEDVEDAKKLVIKRWEETYKPSLGVTISVAPALVAMRGSEWLTPAVVEPVRPIDSIYTYLEDPVLSASAIQLIGGVMEYWYNAEQCTPHLAAMGSDFCSAPTSSTDAERAFSDGRREVNFMQHNTLSQTFKASMAVGSWDGTPLLPDFPELTQLMRAKLRGDAGLSN
ncbi:hypothetical protein SCP_0804310 [Sparassis crispa]|uniref:HAT C-terminal dimerisation domain-containing protein n=1 Tax=Sparassis crispa TaxID=139825 RepID=A0A401GUJ5_9APHY|nr:hypothetical protein SCP_0804310 [Sparassis crispa]GBE85907.1 hypothetical protein SCP_0804310 [Sparassis crispa]